MVDSYTTPLGVREMPPGADARSWGDPLFDDGVVCWDTPDYTRAFAWAPATEEGDRGTYLTYKTAPESADAEGYNQTYLFTGDAITMASTKAETDLIVGPPAA
jgi:hypothetical protein